VASYKEVGVMKNVIIGRQKEQNILNSLKESGKSEFVAQYGRRRVGKTFLVREFLPMDLRSNSPD
jgi:AAA+ ATPase superfamily predicted ATPase